MTKLKRRKIIKRSCFIILIFTMGALFQGCVKQTIMEQNEPNTTIQNQQTASSTKEESSATKAIDVKNEFIKSKMDAMTLEDKIGQLFMIAIRKDLNDHPVIEFDRYVKNIMDEYKPGGVILFGENIDTITQTQKFIYDLQENSNVPLFIGIDEEGGSVSRLQKSGKIGATKLPKSKEVGDKNDKVLAYELGVVIGTEVSALGFNMDFAPVADINTNSNNPVIGDRAFSSDSIIVGDMVAAEVNGIQSQNVSAVIKHFPGHGDTHTDTHTGSTYVESDMIRLREVELAPFVKGIRGGTDGIMIAHIILPKVTEDNVPASLSKKIITGILREKLKYNGLVITDALNMGAITNEYEAEQVAIMAIDAGVDILLMPEDIEKTYRTVLDLVVSNKIPESRIDESLMRILSTKYDRDLFSENKINKNAEALLGNQKHQNIVNKILEK